MPREVRPDQLSSGLEAEEYHRQFEDPSVALPNCAGYVLSALGIVNPERYIDPRKSEFYNLIEQHFVRTSSADNADVVAMTQAVQIPLADEEVIFRGYLHLAVLDKDRPGMIYERQGPGEDVTERLLSAALESYATDATLGPSFEPLYLRLRNADNE